MNTISVVIITLNEEKNIGRCLESLKNVADEIIVLDSYSTDRTKEICQRYSVSYWEREWKGYSGTKNYANSLAKSEYILSVDADEALSPELEKALIEFKKTESPSLAYSLNRITNYCGKWIKHCGWYPDRKIRLWKKGAAKWVGEIHETLEFVEGPEIWELKGDLYHYSFHAIKQHVEQINKFTEIGALQSFEKGKRTTLFKIFIYPKWKFFRDYIIKLGFLDGYYGYVVCKNSAHAKFLKYIKLYALQKQNGGLGMNEKNGGHNKG